jgi:hypothetical protein
MMDSSLLSRLIAAPEVFRQHLLIDTDTGPHPLAHCLDTWQAADFAALDSGWRRVAGHDIAGAQRAYLERPRGHSKTADLAVMATWALFAARKQITGVAAAADKDQARLLRDSIAKLVSLNTWLAPILEVQAYRVANRRTGSTLEILSADALSSYGLTPDFIVADELTHWPSDALWVSLLSAAAKRAHSMLVIISNAGVGAGSSWQWKIRASAEIDPDWYFHSLNGCCASWISAKHLAEQRRLLPSIAFDRLWQNRWTTGAGDALDHADIARAVVCRGPLRRRKPGHVVVGGIDVGLRRDSSCFLVLSKSVGETRVIERPGPDPVVPKAIRVAREIGMLPPPTPTVETVRHIRGTGRLRVCDVKVWRPRDSGGKVSLERIERHILQANEVYGGFDCVAYDPSQMEGSAERLEKAGIPMIRVPFTGPMLSEVASMLVTAFAENGIQLYQHDQLLSDLRSLRIEERSFGVRLVSPRTKDGHGDSVSALCVAMMAAKDFDSYSLGDFTVDHDLVY